MKEIVKYFELMEKMDGRVYQDLMNYLGEEQLKEVLDSYIRELGNVELKEFADNELFYERQLAIWYKFGYYLARLEHNPFEGVISDKFKKSSGGVKRPSQLERISTKQSRPLFTAEEEVYYGFQLLKRDYIVFLNEDGYSFDIAKVFGGIKSRQGVEKILELFSYLYNNCTRCSYFDEKFKKFLSEYRARSVVEVIPDLEESGELLGETVLEDKDLLDEGLLLEQVEMYVKYSIAVDKFTNSNIRMVESIVRKYKNNDILDEDDLFQTAMGMGLSSAIRKFDIRRGQKFSTYAYFWINQAILRLFASDSRMIRVPIYLHEQMKEVEKVKSNFYLVNGRMPTRDEILELMGLSLVQFDNLMLALHRVNNCMSLDNYILDTEFDEDLTFVEAMEGLGINVEGEVLERVNNSKIFEVMDCLLGEEDKEVLFRLYGIGYDGEMKPGEVASLFGCSRQAIEQRRDRALKKLKNSYRIRRLTSFDE